MKRLLAALVILVALALEWPGIAQAVPPGFSVEFDGKGEGKVTFTGAKHTGKDMHCSTCHMEIFHVSRSAPITRADHKHKQACFVCHDGERAFAPRKNCDRCHAEPEEPLAEAEPATAEP